MIMAFSVAVVIFLLSVLHFGCVALGAVSCYTENPVTSSCVLSESCPVEHPPGQEESECLDKFVSTEAMYPPHIMSCPRNSRCNSFTDHNQIEWQYFRVSSVDVEVTGLDSLHFAVNVSWNYTHVEEAIHNPRPGRGLQGYELRLLRDNVVVECLCVSGPRIFSTVIGLNLTLRYRPSSQLQAVVYTLPFSNNFHEDDYARPSQHIPWPSSCNNIHSSFLCPPPLYRQPRHIMSQFIVTSDLTNEVLVSWLPSSSSEPAPWIYYVYYTDQVYNYTFFVNGTHNITMSGLNSSEAYSVQIQAYFPCSGLSMFSSTLGTGVIGCGLLSSIPEHVRVTTSSSTNDTTLPTVPPSWHLVLNIVIPLLAVVVTMLVLGIVGICLLTYLRCGKNDCKNDSTSNMSLYGLLPPVINIVGKPPHLDVLVLYTLKTPKEEQALLEQYVVSRLMHYPLNVFSSNNHIENTIMHWVEEQTRLARAVLIVCNKSFHMEWSLPSQQRSPLINALATIIDGAVSQGSIKKYAILLLGEKSDKYIPENSYLNSMEKFVVKVDSSDNDIKKIASFVKCNH